MTKKAPEPPKAPFALKGAKVEEAREGVARVTWPDGQSCEVGYDGDTEQAKADAMAWKRARS